MRKRTPVVAGLVAAAVLYPIGVVFGNGALFAGIGGGTVVLLTMAIDDVIALLHIWKFSDFALWKRLILTLLLPVPGFSYIYVTFFAVKEGADLLTDKE